MAENRALILPADLVDRVDANRGDMSRSDFVKFLLDQLLSESQPTGATNNHVTHDELEEFQQDMRGMLRSFLDFFLTYGLELGASPNVEELRGKALKLQDVVGLADDSKTASSG